MKPTKNTVSLSIMDRSFVVACAENEKNDLIASATFLDSRMREVQGNGKFIGYERCAVAAALNICNELLHRRTPVAPTTATASSMLADNQWQEDLEHQLSEITDKIELALDKAQHHSS